MLLLGHLFPSCFAWFEAHLYEKKEWILSLQHLGCVGYLPDILGFRPHVLLQHEELVPHPSSLDSLNRRHAVPPVVPQTPVMLLSPPVRRRNEALVQETPEEQQHTVPREHWKRFGVDLQLGTLSHSDGWTEMSAESGGK